MFNLLQIEPAERNLLFQVGCNKETLITSRIFLILMVSLFLISAYFMHSLILVVWPLLTPLLLWSISLVRTSRLPLIIARDTNLELSKHATGTVIQPIPWSNILSFELSQPYKDQLIINLQDPIHVKWQGKTSKISLASKSYGIDPDDLLIQLSACLNPSLRNATSGVYLPNHLSLRDRIGKISGSTILLAWATYGLVMNDFPMPTKQPMHLHGIASWLMGVAFVLASINLLSWVLDHYDTRNNERAYRKFRSYTGVIGYLFFFTALVYSISH
jgi:hypothetical protein